MRAVLYEEFTRPPSLARVPDPAPSPAGVVIRVTASGICRSDWHAWMGHDPDVRVPHVPGHELAGVVEAVGTGVRRWRGGERVTVPFVCACGSCPQCACGNHQVCDQQFQPGFTHWGSFAELVAIDNADVNLVRLPDGIDDFTAATLGCRFVTAWRAVVDRGGLAPGEWLAVHGCGGVGLSAIMIASALGARVVGVDIDEGKLALAQSVGAEVVIDARQHEDVATQVHGITGGGAQVSLDALGSAATCINSVCSLAKRGRHVQVGLLLAGDSGVRLPMERVIGRELQILGSHGMQAHRYAPLLDMILARRLEPRRLIGRTIALEEAPAALAAMADFPGRGVTIIDRF